MSQFLIIEVDTRYSVYRQMYLNGHWDDIEEFNHPYQNIRMDRFSCFTTTWSNWSMFEQWSKYIALELIVYSLGCCQVWNFKVVTHWVSTWVTELLDGRGSLRIWRRNNYYYFFVLKLLQKLSLALVGVL